MHLVVLGTGIVGTCTGAWLLAKGREMFSHLDSSRFTRWMGLVAGRPTQVDMRPFAPDRF